MTIDVQKIATGFEFTEGPAWHPDGFLVFSDIPANCIYKLGENNEVSKYIDASGFTGNDTGDLDEQIGSNGIAITPENEIILCQHGNHGIAKIDTNGNLQQLLNQYQGKPLNSPNDLVIHSNGSIYFTDPPYGLKDQVLNKEKYQDHSGIYCFREDQLRLLRTDMEFPNGLCFTPDEKYLYVTSNHREDPSVLRFPVDSNGDLEEPVRFATCHADGMTLDKKGNLLLATDDGIVLLTAEGKKAGTISVPETPSNITWGGQEHDQLYITARTSIYRVHASALQHFY